VDLISPNYELDVERP